MSGRIRFKLSAAQSKNVRRLLNEPRNNQGIVMFSLYDLLTDGDDGLGSNLSEHFVEYPRGSGEFFLKKDSELSMPIVAEEIFPDCLEFVGWLRNIPVREKFAVWFGPDARNLQLKENASANWAHKKGDA